MTSARRHRFGYGGYLPNGGYGMTVLCARGYVVPVPVNRGLFSFVNVYFTNYRC